MTIRVQFVHPQKMPDPLLAGYAVRVDGKTCIKVNRALSVRDREIVIRHLSEPSGGRGRPERT